MATYLQLTQKLVAELGIGGANNGATVPTAVTAQTGQLWNAANWIAEAHNNLSLLHVDWNFLHTNYQETLSVGSTAIPAHSGSEVVKKWDRSSFFLDVSTGGGQLEFMDWPEFRATIYNGYGNRSNGKPTTFTIKPDGSILLDNPCDQAYTLDAEFWKRPTVLAADGDTGDIPQEYQRLIICEAAIKYANKESAIEIIQGMEAEYLLLYHEMQADQLPMRESDRMGAEDHELTVQIPGYL
jgi:hypothetical protein